MTKNDIITGLYSSKEFNDCINKMHPECLRDDLRAEVSLVICEQDEDFLRTLYDKHELNYWVVRVVLNMIKSDTSGFYRKFRHPLIEYTENLHDGYTKSRQAKNIRPTV